MARNFRRGDVVCLLSQGGKRWFVKVGESNLSTHKGTFSLSPLEGAKSGSILTSHIGCQVRAFFPTFEEIILYYVNRTTQIVYPKDLGYLLLKLAIKEGMTVLEAGTGSGAATLILAHWVGESGRVITYEKRPNLFSTAEKLFQEFGMEARIVCKMGDIQELGEEEIADACFLDLRDPVAVIPAVFRALVEGATFAIVVPTTNQVSETIEVLQEEGAMSLEVSEIFLRKYKINSNRLRPEDRMVGHTVFLISGRRMRQGG
ncbi:MAG: methyltransferase domain-containing protein [Candidatus Ratteibacteria bacterium]